MKKFYLTISSLIFVLIIGSNLQNLQSKSNGSIISYTGAPKATGGFELTCTNCHGGTANTGPNSVNISVNGNPAGYEAGQSYSITAKIVNPTGSPRSNIGQLWNIHGRHRYPDCFQCIYRQILHQPLWDSSQIMDLYLDCANRKYS